MPSDYQYITTGTAARTFAEVVRTAPWTTLDTEFVRERTYFPVPCLLQIVAPPHTAVVDTLAVDIHPLLEVIETTPGDKIFHAAGQDLEIWAQLRGATPEPLFDTQIAAALLGFGEQLGYAALVEKTLGEQLDKTLTRTDWSKRPLSRAAIDYAAADVTHLAELYPRLLDELQRAGRLDWLREDCRRLADPRRYAADPPNAWRQLRGLQRLPVAARSAAMTLAAWREREAISRNRPRRWILDDATLLSLAERRPQAPGQLRDLLPPAAARAHGDALLEILHEREHPEPPEPTPPLDEHQKQRFDELRAACQRLSGSLNIPGHLLATRSELEALARDPEATVRLRNGWRAQFAARLGL